MVKNALDNAGDIRDLDYIHSLGMASHSNIPAWKMPWTEKTGGLQSIGSQSVRHN